MNTPPPSSDPWILAIDVGTSSVRTRFYDLSGRPPAASWGAQLAYEWRTTPDGGMEADAEALFALTCAVLDGATRQARSAGTRIAGVATSVFWHSVLGVSGGGAPLTPLYSWGDSRAARWVPELRARVDPERTHQRTGCFLHSSYPSAKLLWLANEDGATFRRASAWVSFGEFLALRWFGERRCSLSMASGTGLFDTRRLCWDAEMLDAVGVDESLLSPLTDVDTPFRGLRPEFRARWPELADLPWFPALGDGACANVGSGAVGPNRYGVTVGTSAAARALWESEKPSVFAPDLWCYRLDRRRLVSGLALSNGGNAIAFLEQTLRLPPLAELDAALARVAPASHGLVVLASLVAERSVVWAPELRGALIGVTQDTDPIQIARAWMEAIAFRIAYALEVLGQVFGEPREVIVGGGALRNSAVWTQMIADAAGCTLSLSAERETSSRGAALVTLEQLGLFRAVDPAAAPPRREFHPDPATHARYVVAMRRHRELNARLGDWLARTPPPELPPEDGRMAS